MRIICLVTLILTMLSGCSNKAKQSLGLVTTAPNEYQVQRSKSLEIPPHYDLQKPVEEHGKACCDSK